MSELAVRCEDLPVREEALSGAMLAQVQGGGIWWPIVKKGAVELGKLYITGKLYDGLKEVEKRATDYWDECQAEADTEALAESRHEFRRAYYNKAG